MAIMILAAGDQEVAHTPARPVASATWVLEDLRQAIGATGRVLASGAASVNVDEYVLDGDAGPAQASVTKVPLATTGALEAGQLVWIEDAGGGGEQLELDAVVPDDYARARYQLVAGYEAGSTVRALTMGATVPDAVTGNEALLGVSLRVTWSYDIDARPVRAQTMVCLQRSEGISGELAQAKAFAVGMFPQLAEQARAGGRELDGWAETARSLIEFDLRHEGHGIEPSMFLLDERANQLIGLKLLILAALNDVGPKGMAEWLKTLRSQYTRMWDALTVGTPGLGSQETNEADQAVGSPSRAGMSFAL